MLNVQSEICHKFAHVLAWFWGAISYTILHSIINYVARTDVELFKSYNSPHKNPCPHSLSTEAQMFISINRKQQTRPSFTRWNLSYFLGKLRLLKPKKGPGNHHGKASQSISLSMGNSYPHCASIKRVRPCHQKGASRALDGVFTSCTEPQIAVQLRLKMPSLSSKVSKCASDSWNHP